MNRPNPYEAPHVAQVAPQMVASAPTGQGVWSDGKYLVVSKMAALPSVCVLTNQKPKRAITRKFQWHHPALYLTLFAGLIIFVILALLLRKTQKLDLPLSETSLQKRKKAMTICWTIGLLSVAIIVGGFVGLVGEVFGNGAIGALMIIGGFVGVLITAVVGSRFASILTPKKITEHAGWYGGASAQYLARLPSLPPNFQ